MKVLVHYKEFSSKHKDSYHIVNIDKIAPWLFNL